MKTNLFLIIGDPFLRSRRVKALISGLEKEAGTNLSQQTFRLSEISFETVLASARTLPFLAAGQVLLVREAEALKDSGAELLTNYVKTPAKDTILILEADASEGLAEVIKTVKAAGQVITLAKEESRTVAQGYLQQKLARFKKSMTPGAKRKLLEMCGDAVGFLDTMLDRVIQYAGEKTVIDEDMVSEFGENWREANIFQLTNAILARDRVQALRMFRELAGSGDSDPQSLVGIIHWQMRQLWHAAVLREAGIPDVDVLSRVKVPAFRKAPFLASVSRYGLPRLEAAIEALYQLDKKAKTGLAKAVPGIESWLLEFVA
jgi:DNA polymerase-3 subunit delta